MTPTLKYIAVGKRCAAGLASLALLFTVGCDSHKPPPPATPIVQVVDVVQRDVPIYMEWVGSVDGSVNAVIRPQVTGYLIKQAYREGDLVKKGQLLFEIDPRTFQAALDGAISTLAREEVEVLTAKAAVHSAELDLQLYQSEKWRPHRMYDVAPTKEAG